MLNKYMKSQIKNCNSIGFLAGVRGCLYLLLITSLSGCSSLSGNYQPQTEFYYVFSALLFLVGLNLGWLIGYDRCQRTTALKEAIKEVREMPRLERELELYENETK